MQQGESVDSPTAYQRQLPVDEMKVDCGCLIGIQGVNGATGNATIVRSTIELAYELGLRVVGQGVETAARLQRLAEIGCDEAQGCQMGKSMPLAELQAWAMRWVAAQTQGPAPAPAAAAREVSAVL
ncbi:MAG: EAL domain-containing protein [Rubrivivax sp.]|nr:EAL domain-containing protein [Rubrivivax sp.]